MLFLKIYVICSKGEERYSDARDLLAVLSPQCFQDVQVLGGYDRRSLANKVFGSERVTATLRAVEETVLGGDTAFTTRMHFEASSQKCCSCMVILSWRV